MPAGGLFVSTLQVVLLPILGGLILKKYFPAAVKKVLPACPLVAVITVALICASIIGRVALTPGCQIGDTDHTGCHSRV